VGTAATKQALGQDLRKSSGSFAIFAAIRRAPHLWMSNLAADPSRKVKPVG
jgi:hypothetical protein